MEERLQKIIARSGRASRRAAEQLIAAGRVAVNGKVVITAGTTVDPLSSHITVDSTPLPRITTLTYALYKPRGVVCSRRRQANEPIVTDLVPDSPPVFPIGRLDKESEGLILLTNDGNLTHELTHPSHQHPKEYRVVARWQTGTPPREATWIREKLLRGVRLGDGPAAADSITVTELAPAGQLTLTITVHEGRTHLIRRMCATIGLDIICLTRVRIGKLTLASLRPGRYRILSESELKRVTDS